MEHQKDQKGLSGFERLSAFFHGSNRVQHFAGGRGKSNFIRRFGGALLVAGLVTTPIAGPAIADSAKNLINSETMQQIIDGVNERLMQMGATSAPILVVSPGQPVDAMKGDVCPAETLSPELNRWDATRALTGLDRSIRLSYQAEDIHRFAADHAAAGCIADELMQQNPDASWSKEQFATVFAALNQIATGAPDAMIRELSQFYIEAESKFSYPEILDSPGMDIIAKDMRSLKRELAGAGVDRIIAKTMEILPRQKAAIVARFDKRFESLQKTFTSLADIYADMDADDFDAIRKASNETGVDFAELMTKIAIESAFDEQAEADKSTATGLGQHIDQTWLAAVFLYGNQFGMDEYVKDITRRKNKSGAYIYSVADDAREQEILELRNDRYYSAALTGALMLENNSLLRARLGRSVNATDRYIAHMMGPTDAVTLIRAAAQGDLRPAKDLFPAQNNPAVYNPRFFKRGNTHLAAPTVYENIDQFISGRLRQFKQLENSPVSDRDLFARTNTLKPNGG